MKYELSATKSWYSKEEAKKLEKLGFDFDEEIEYEYERFNEMYIRGYNPVIELETISDLVAFVKEYGPIVMQGDTIEIYNGYRE